MRKAGNQVRITAQLIDSETGDLWADRFDGSLEDVFELQDQVTTSVVGMHLSLPGNRSRRSVELDAYDCFSGLAYLM